MSLLDLIVGNGKKARHEEYSQISKRLDDIEEILRDISLKSEDKFDAVLRGVETVMPQEKGQFISRVEERIAVTKRDMVTEAVLAECARDAASYPELRRGVRNRTGLSVSGVFLDSCVKKLAYDGKIERVGSRFVSSGSIRRTEPVVHIAAKTGEIEFISELMEEPAILNECSGNGGMFEKLTTSDEGNGHRKPEAIREPAKPEGNGNRFSKLDAILKIVSTLEASKGAVPIEAIVSESGKRGMSKDDATQLIDEHLMITGQLYEAKQGHVKTVKPSLIA